MQGYRRRLGLLFGFSLIVSTLAASGVCLCANERWQVGVAPSYFSGNYGTDTTTTITYLPLIIRRLFQDGDISLTVPYVSITSNGAVTLVGGVPNRTSKSGTSGNGNSGSGGSGSGGGGGQGQGSSKEKRPGNVLPSKTTDSGIGDLVLRARYYVIEERAYLPLVAATGRVKFPTADESRGLGTGQFDEGVGLEFSKQLTEQIIGFADVGYTIIGKPDNVPLRNQWNYALGVGYSFTRNLLGSVYYEEYRALISGLQNPRDLLFTVNYKATSAFRMNASLQVGLSSGAPDYGLTGGVSYRF